MEAKERDERIRKAYFADGKSIKQIAQEFHHSCEHKAEKTTELLLARKPAHGLAAMGHGVKLARKEVISNEAEKDYCRDANREGSTAWM